MNYIEILFTKCGYIFIYFSCSSDERMDSELRGGIYKLKVENFIWICFIHQKEPYGSSRAYQVCLI